MRVSAAMRGKLWCGIFRAVAVLLFLLPCSLFAERVSADLRFVFLTRESSDAVLFLKADGGYKRINGAAFALPKTSMSYSGDSVAGIFEKRSDGNYEKCAEFEIPENAHKCLVAISAPVGLLEGEEDPGYIQKYSASALEFSEKDYRAGTLNVLNFSGLSLRAHVVDGAPVTLKPKAAGTIFSITAGKGSQVVDFRIVTAAKDAESAQKAWRVGNSISVVEKQKYFLAVVPGKKRERKPPQCEIFSIRTE